MLRRIFRRLRRLVSQARPMPRFGPAGVIRGDAVGALTAAGARRVGELAPVSVGGAVALGAPSEGAHVLGVVVVAAALGGPVMLRLVRGDGAVADEVPCPAGVGYCRVVLFAAAEAGVRLEVAGGGRMRCESAELWALDAGAVEAEALVPQVALAADAGWSRAYGTPDALDAGARLRAWVFAAMERPALVEVLGGMKLWLEPGDELSRAVLISGVYEPETLLVVRAVLPVGGVCVDVGAHCGFVSAFAARCVGGEGRVLSFEPSPREFARLEGNVAAGGLAQVTVRQAAVDAEVGEVTLRLAEAGHAGHHTIGSGFAYAGVAVAELAVVAASTLDAALAGLERCDLIKMDIEGAELRALRGGAEALARLRPTLILEVFDRALAGCGDTEAALFGWLAEHGYAARDIDPASGRFDAPAGPAPGVSRNIVAVPVG